MIGELVVRGSDHQTGPRREALVIPTSLSRREFHVEVGHLKVCRTAGMSAELVCGVNAWAARLCFACSSRGGSDTGVGSEDGITSRPRMIPRRISISDSSSGSLFSAFMRVPTRRPYPLAIVPEQPRPTHSAAHDVQQKGVSVSKRGGAGRHARRTPDEDPHAREDRVALAEPERVVHRGREQREPEPRERPQKRRRSQR